MAPAARDDAQGRFLAGDAVGFVEEELIAWDPPRDAPRRARAARRGRGAHHLPARRRAPLDDAAVQALAAGDVEFELSDGGQPATGGCSRPSEVGGAASPTATVVIIRAAR